MGKMKYRISIIYRYFLEQDGKIGRIPFRESKHREKLMEHIRKEFPGYMQGYASIYGHPAGQDEAVVKVIDVFQNHRTSLIHKIKRKIMGG